MIKSYYYSITTFLSEKCAGKINNIYIIFKFKKIKIIKPYLGTATCKLVENTKALMR